MDPGSTSSVIAGLDWVIANRVQHRIRVVNLSLGHPVTGPCVTDPLCSSIARVVANGIVVVASAGNHGKTADGQAVLGGISSPGNSPMALTVGALNTWNTVIRSDDTVTTYSSRGPTAYDFVVKPDVVAPGNKIVSLEAPNGYLARNYGSLHVAGSGTNAYYRMSGTSMSAGMVSGAVALLLEAVPGLDPAQVEGRAAGDRDIPAAGRAHGGGRRQRQRLGRAAHRGNTLLAVAADQHDRRCRRASERHGVLRSRHADATACMRAAGRTPAVAARALQHEQLGQSADRSG